ncbi:MAG: class I tRNA ligase family protein, partial [Elioraea sp.]|nr:class I tRNA ligase family protein [Elioraea sp.]
ALAEAEIEYRERRSPAIDVAFPAADPGALAAAFGVRWADAAAVPVWTTTPWTLPGNQAVALGPDLGYALVAAELEDGRSLALVLAEPLVRQALERYRARSAQTLARRPGRALEGLRLRHPYEPRTVPVVLGEHVLAEEGTGAVHTAPGHGEEDFVVGERYGLPVSCPVEGDGRFAPG